MKFFVRCSLLASLAGVLYCPGSGSVFAQLPTAGADALLMSRATMRMQTHAHNKVLVVPMKADNSAASALYTDALVAALEKLYRYEILSPNEVGKRIKVSRAFLSSLSPDQIRQLGTMLNVDAILTGSVESVTVGDQPAIHTKFKMTESSTGSVIWDAESRDGSPDNPAVLASFARTVTASLFKKLAPALPDVVETIDMSAAFMGFNVEATGLHDTRLSWKRSSDPNDQYRIERSRAKAGPYQTAAILPNVYTEYIDRGTALIQLKPDTEYFYRVATVNNNQVSAPSAPISARTLPSPKPPQAIGVLPLSGPMMELTWSPSTSKDIVGYQVERSSTYTPEIFELIGETDETTFMDDGKVGAPMEFSEEYIYRIKAKHAAGIVGKPSAPVDSKTRAYSFFIESFTAGDRNIRNVPLSWKSSQETNVVAYLIYRKRLGDEDFSLIKVIKDRLVKDFTDGGQRHRTLPDNTLFSYKVQAVNTTGVLSDFSPTLTVTTRDIPPVVIGVVADSGQARQVSLEWGASPDDEVVAYEVWRSIDLSGAYKRIARLKGRTTSGYVDRGLGKGSGGLADGRMYRYKIFAINSQNVASKPSREIMARTKTVPNAPGDLQVALGERPKSVRIRWTTSPEPDVTSYLLQAAKDGSFRSAKDFRVSSAGQGGNALSAVVDQKRGATRFFRVRGVDKDGLASPWSNALIVSLASDSKTVKADDMEAPGRPVGLSASASDPKEILVNWNSVVGRDVEFYRVQTSTDPSFKSKTEVKVSSGGKTEYVATGLDDGSERFFRVCATSKKGVSGPWSQMAHGQAKPAPLAPRNLAVEHDKGYFILTWDPPPETEIAKFRLWTSRRLSKELMESTRDARLVIPVRDVGKKFQISVSTEDVDGLTSGKSPSLSLDRRLVEDTPKLFF